MRYVPRDQQALRHLDGSVEQQAHETENEDCREYAWCIEPVRVIDQQIAEAPIGRDELSDDGSRGRKRSRNLEAGEESRERVRHLHLPEHAPSTRARDARKIADIGVERAKPLYGRDDDRKERQQNTTSTFEVSP